MSDEMIDPYAEVKRLTTTLGDIRTELISEGFNEDETFALCIEIIRVMFSE